MSSSNDRRYYDRRESSRNKEHHSHRRRDDIRRRSSSRRRRRRRSRSYDNKRDDRRHDRTRYDSNEDNESNRGRYKERIKVENNDVNKSYNTIPVISEEVNEKEVHRAAVASAAAAAIAAAKNVAKTQEKHELDRRMAIARASAKAATKKAKNTCVLPGFASINDDDEEEEEVTGKVVVESDKYHSGDDSTTSSIPIMSHHHQQQQLPIHNTKTKQMDDFLDEIKSRYQLRHEAEDIKDKLNKGYYKGIDEIHIKETRLANLQARLGGIATLQESEMIGKAMRGINNDGEYYDYDDDTANLYIANLPFGVTEDMLIKEFGNYGSITSVKIMYPRTDEERSRGYVPAFIAFSNRDDAQAAKDAMESGPCTFGGAMMRETVLRVGWGKAMNSAQVKTAQRNKSMLVQVAQAGSHHITDISNTTTRTSRNVMQHQGKQKEDEEEKHSSNFSQPKASLHINVQLPKSDKQRSLIDKIARLVADNGRNIEQVAIMRVQARYGSKERYNFLFDYDSPEGQYYRWRTFAYAQGDSGQRWRIEPFIMCQGNPLCNDPAVLWYPPPLSKAAANAAAIGSIHSDIGGGRGGGADSRGTAASRSDIERGPGGRIRTKVGGQTLSTCDKTALIGMLTNMTTNRESIKEVMVWCIDHTDNSNEIVNILVNDIINKRKKKIDKIPILYLISDILHNSGCSTKNGTWSYRTQIEYKCALIIYQFNNNSTNGVDVDDDIVMQKCYRVLNAWEQNAIFGPEYLRGLVATLMRIPNKDDLDKVKLTEEKDKHFSQLERWCRNNGLLWEYPSSIGNNADDKKEWLLMQIANEKLYSMEIGRSDDITGNNNDDDIDGESVDSDDISIDDDEEDDEEDIDGEALILPGDGIEVINDDEEEELDGVPL